MTWTFSMFNSLGKTISRVHLTIIKIYLDISLNSWSSHLTQKAFITYSTIFGVISFLLQRIEC